MFCAMWRGESKRRSAELVWVAQLIASCGENGREGDRREIAQRRVRALEIVVSSPDGDLAPRLIEVEGKRPVRVLMVPFSGSRAEDRRSC